MSNRTCGLIFTLAVIALAATTVLTATDRTRWWWTLLVPIGISFTGAVIDHYTAARRYKQARRGQHDAGIRRHARNAQIRHAALQRQRVDFPQWETEVNAEWDAIQRATGDDE